jgi:hypothetical protein
MAQRAALQWLKGPALQWLKGPALQWLKGRALQWLKGPCGCAGAAEAWLAAARPGGAAARRR